MQKEHNVSAIIPCRNEEQFIIPCITSLLAQTYPKEHYEILIVDGMSSDKTRALLEPYLKQYNHIKRIDNPKFIIPSAMNIGIRRAKGDIIMKMDAHTLYPNDYIERNVTALEKLGADNVGGVLETLPSATTIQARSIAFVLSHPFGVGGSPFRTATASQEPREVDTVAFGCYKKEVFRKIGLYNEKLERSSDMELNTRLRKAGGKIFLVPSITARYFPAATLIKFLNHNIQDGIWAIYPLAFIEAPFSLRHYVPLGFVLLLIISFILRFFWLPTLLYAFAAVYVALPQAAKEKNVIYVISIPLAFAIRHIGYGAGSLIGLIKIVARK